MPNGQVEMTRSIWSASLQEFAELLRQRREDKLRLTQVEMAARLGVNQSTVSRVETGARPRDKAAALAFAHAYRLTNTEVQMWLELLFGSKLLPAAAAPDQSEARYGQQLERAYGLLDGLGSVPPPYIYITTLSQPPLPCAT